MTVEERQMPAPTPSPPAAAPATNGRPHPIRRLYDWVLHWAATPHAQVALFALAFAESSFFPIPPDVLLLAMAISVPTRAFRYALVSTIGSVLGGMAGYVIGWGCWHVVQPVFIPHVFSAAIFEEVCRRYNEQGALIVFTAAFTPIPYKVITISAGVASINFVTFVVASVIGRAGRFFLVALLVRIFGKPIRAFIERYFNAVTLVFTVLLIGSFVLVRYWNEIEAWIRGLF